MKESDAKKNNVTIYAVIMAVIVGLVLLVIFLLNYQKETRISETYKDADLSSLACSTTTSSELTFFENTADNAKHELKMVFSDGVIDKISYEFRGEYGSWETADQDEGVLHARYNNYMGEHGLENTMLTPVFQNVDGKLKIGLYLDNYKKNMSPAIAKLFYIEDGSMNVVAKSSITEMKEYYENKGFSCIMGE